MDDSSGCICDTSGEIVHRESVKQLITTPLNSFNQGKTWQRPCVETRHVRKLWTVSGWNITYQIMRKVSFTDSVTRHCISEEDWTQMELNELWGQKQVKHAKLYSDLLQAFKIDHLIALDFILIREDFSSCMLGASHWDNFWKMLSPMDHPYEYLLGEVTKVMRSKARLACRSTLLTTKWLSDHERRWNLEHHMRASTAVHSIV